MDLRRLLLAFVGLALFLLALFGVLAHRIAQDSADQQQINILLLLAHEEVQQLQQWLEQGLSPKAVLDLKRHSKHGINIVMLDGGGKVLATNAVSNEISSPLSAAVTSLHHDQHNGKITLGDKNYIWAHEVVPGRDLQVVLFLEQQNTVDSPYINIGTRLAITGAILIWISVWAALILFGHISRKTSKLEAERSRSDEWLRLLLNSTAEAIYGIDTEGSCTICNPAALKMLGYASETDLLGKNIHNLIHHTKADGSPHPLSDCVIGQVIYEGKGVHVQNDIFWRADGSHFPVEYRGHPIFSHHEIVGAVVTFLDTSEKLQAEQEMRKLSQVIEQASDAVFITDSNGLISYVNPAFESITGYSKAEIMGQHFNVLSAAYHKNQHDDTLWQQVRGGETFSGVRLNKRKDNEEFYAQEVVAPLKDTFGEITHIVFTCKDISVQLEQEAKIQSVIIEKQLAEQANREKSSFLANMSHELRTPLNAVIGYSELLQEEFDDMRRPELVRDLQQIHAAGSHLLVLINDILDFSKIEAGKLELHFEEVSISEMVQQVVDIITPMMTKNHNHFVVQVPETAGLMQTDVIRLRQCLFNLLSNASKFAQGGNVTLTVAKALRRGEPWVKFTVQDDGIGIADDKITKLFKEFSQADGTTTRRFGGTGLGLTISRRLVQMMGGDIRVHSQLEEGSTFTIYVPAFAHAVPMNQAARTG